MTDDGSTMPGERDEQGLAWGTIALAASDVIDRLGPDAPVGGLPDPASGRAQIEQHLMRPGFRPPVPGADLAFRLAVANAAHRPHRLLPEGRDTSRTRDQLERLIEPAVRPGADPGHVLDVIQSAHAHGQQQGLVPALAPLVQPGALLFFDIECEGATQTELVAGKPCEAKVVFDRQDTTLTLDELHATIDPLNWPLCNECFQSVEPVPGTFWRAGDTYGFDMVEVFNPLPGVSYRTALSITFIVKPGQRWMVYDLSDASAHLGDGQVDVDRGYASVQDHGTFRRLEGLKVVHFGDDEAANASVELSCLWWDLLTIRSALLCQDRRPHDPDDLERTVGSAPAKEAAARPAVDSEEPPGPLESMVRNAGSILRDTQHELAGLTTRTVKRWPAGEPVTGGKITNDLIEAFERWTPLIGRDLDLHLDAAQRLTRPNRKDPAP